MKAAFPASTFAMATYGPSATPPPLYTPASTALPHLSALVRFDGSYTMPLAMVGSMIASVEPACMATASTPSVMPKHCDGATI